MLSYELRIEANPNLDIFIEDINIFYEVFLVSASKWRPLLFHGNFSVWYFHLSSRLPQCWIAFCSLRKIKMKQEKKLRRKRAREEARNSARKKAEEKQEGNEESQYNQHKGTWKCGFWGWFLHGKGVVSSHKAMGSAFWISPVQSLQNPNTEHHPPWKICIFT